MKHVTFLSLPPQARFQLDDQWWIKVVGGRAKHATFDVSIDLKSSCLVSVRGDKPDTSIEHDSTRQQLIKRESLFVALGTLLELFNWPG